MIHDARIFEQNPWWRDPGMIRFDSHLVPLRGGAFSWQPAVLEDIPFRPGDLSTLRGPRQVGKTTTTKLMIRRLLDQGQQRVLYYSFDLDRESAALPDVIRRAKALSGFPAGSWYIFLDEVTSVPDWQRGIKYAWDAGLTRGDFVLCTGSSARRMGTEQLPGRRGRGGDYLQLPISFRDYCRSVCGIPLPEQSLSAAEVLHPEGRDLLKQVYHSAEALQAALAVYRNIGGFPAAVKDYLAGGQVSPETFAMLWAMLSNEMRQARLDPVSAVKLIERVGISAGSSLTWHAASEAMGVSSHNTAHQYALALAESFMLLMVYHWSVGGGFEPRKQRKIYFIDPLLGHVPAALSPGARRPDEDGMLEGLVAAGLFRSSIDYATQAEPLPGAFGCWRSTRGRELDFVLPSSRGGKGQDRMAVEVKGDGAADIHGAVLSIRRTFGHGMVVTRTRFEPDADIPLIPVPVLLAVLREHTRREMSEL